MNEMHLIESFCAEEAPPTPERLAAARAKVAAAIEGAAPPSPALSRPGRAMRRMRGTGRAGSPRILTWPKLGIVGAVAATAAVAMIVAGVIPLRPPGTGTGVRLDAATVLHRAARAALGRPAPGRNQFIYTDVRSVGGPPHRSQTVQTWLSADGSRAGAQRLTPCYQAYHQPPSCTYKAPRYRGSPALVSYAWVNTLPTDARALLAYLERSSGCNQLPHHPERRVLDHYRAAYSEVYVILNTLYVLPPKLGAALFDAAAKIPGVTVLPHVANAAGGQGIAVAMTPAPSPASGRRTRYELIFNPHTYRYVGSQTIAFGGSALLASTLLSAGFVNTAPTRYTMSDTRLLSGLPGRGPGYLPWPPPYAWGPAACIFGSLS